MYMEKSFGIGLEEQELFPNRIRYTGQQYDGLTGQYYLRARYYNPVYGRFMQEDVYQGDGLNLYVYCDSNPVVYYDPSGYNKCGGQAKTEDTDEKTRTEQTTQGNVEGGSNSRIRPSNPYDANAKPSGTSARIADNLDDATRCSLMRENETAEVLARNSYNIEHNPVVEGTTRKPDYRIEGEIFDCYSPEGNTDVINIWRTVEEKVVSKHQADNIVLNLDDWHGNLDDLIIQFKDYSIEGLKEIIVVQDGRVFSIYP